MNFELHLGGCIESMRAMPTASVDSIVTDPPYELGFMGKAWDASGIANSVEMWTEALRVLKPGGHLLAFSGSRTYHRMVCAIEDAGFEIRDQIMWVYGSGFPKSLDVSKAIDKQDASDVRAVRQLRFTEWMRSTGMTAARIDQLTGTNMGWHYTTAASQPAVATRDHLEILRPHVGLVPSWVEAMVDERTVESENFKAREVTGQTTKARSTSGKSALPTVGGETIYQTWNETAAHTDAARQWQGWGTALKPAHEPIVVARKPLIGTVAANVLAHGTGALNIDKCRVDADGCPIISEAEADYVASTSRWPANLIHDGSDEVLAAFPQAPGPQAPNGKRVQGKVYGKVNDSPSRQPIGDSGSAARFFYAAKASKSDRGAENVHPTVKPTSLMRYLCRLVTPPGGTVLDPFTGSGSTGKAAVLEGFGFIGCELSPEYHTIAHARISDAASGGFA